MGPPKREIGGCLFDEVIAAANAKACSPEPTDPLSRLSAFVQFR